MPSELEDLFMRLVPNASEITALSGTRYVVPTTVSARCAILASRELRQVLALPCYRLRQEDGEVDLDVAKALKFASSLLAIHNQPEAAKVMAAVFDVGGEGLCRAFAAAYPSVVSVEGDPLDSFTLEAVVGALLPLCGRLGGAAVGLVRAAQPEN